MKIANGLIALTIILAFTSCSREDQIAKDLKGRWQIVSIEGDSLLIQPDSLAQYFEFFDCNDAYTSTCKVVYEVDTLKDTLSYTLKGEELDIITPGSTLPNFNSMLKLKRYFIDELTDTSLQIYRYDDTLTIRAIKI